jgi:hypothetical protein
MIKRRRMRITEKKIRKNKLLKVFPEQRINSAGTRSDCPGQSDLKA